MNCEIVRSPPIVWVCVFATIITISSSITFEDSFAQTSITINPIGSIDDGDGATLELDGAYGITSFKIGSTTYLAVASDTDNGVQILRVSSAGAVSAVSQITDDGTRTLSGASGITSFKIGTSTYLAVAADFEHGVQILRVDSAGAVSAVSQITDDVSLELEEAHGITSFKIGTTTYLAVTGNIDNGVQILRVSSAGAVSAVSQITDDGTRTLSGASGITSFKIGTSTYLAVAADFEHGVQILRVDSAGAVSAVSQITDDGTRTLDGASGITSFKIGTTTYLAVAATNEHGVQILSVSSAGVVSSVSQITDDNTRTLSGVKQITSFKIGSTTYLAVSTSGGEHGVQILSVDSAGAITAVSQITDDNTRTLSGANGITSFKIGSTTYVSVAAFNDDGVQILKLNQPPNANAGRDITGYFGKTITLDGSSSTDPDGDTLDYTWVPNPTDPVTVELTDAGSGRVTFTAPDEPATLEFTLTVSDSSLQDTDTITVTIEERPVQTRNIKEMGDTLVSAQITGPNQITMIYNEQLSTFINSYLNFTISGEDKPRNITGINGSPAIETGETTRINGKQVKTYATTLTFDGEPVSAGSTGSMYMQHADHYLAFIQVSDSQD